MSSRQHKIYLRKMATELGMFSMTHESITVPVGRDRKIRTTMKASQIAGPVTMPSEKKIEN